MKVFVVGATGRVGKILTDQLQKAGHFVYAGARKSDQIKKMENIQPVLFDLHESVAHLADALADSEAVIFVAGSRGSDLLQTDLNGAVNVMKAAEKKGIKRYIQLSSLFSLNPERWEEAGLTKILDYTIAKYFSDSWLINHTSLDYTILQPGSLIEEKGTGCITVNDHQPGKNSIENVATTLLAILETPSTIHQVIAMHDGETPIDKAIKSVN